MNLQLPNLINFRHELHRQPELSGEESHTAALIVQKLSSFHPDKIITGIGGHGVAAVFEGKAQGLSVMLRCELDALPITEVNTFAYRSCRAGMAHKCGHDGHMAILTGVAQALADNKPARGRVILLFQPAEENGEGAARVLADPQFRQIEPDFVFALHNMPGWPFGQIVTKPGTHNAASKGMVVKLHGATSHAAFPEQGKSPALCMSDIMQQLHRLGQEKEKFSDFVLVTLIYARLGEIAFGTTPGYAEVMATLRAFRNEDMQTLARQAIEIVRRAAVSYGLRDEISWKDAFEAVYNDPASIDMIEQVASENNFEVLRMAETFRWSEDFGYFTTKYKGAIFGIGAGESWPSLHSETYDFNDELIGPGVQMFSGIVHRIVGRAAQQR